MLMQWDGRLKVGVTAIDVQHEKLVALVNGFYDAVAAGKGEAALDRTFAELVKYTNYHFADEEKLMRDTAYPGYLEHKAKHAALVRDLLDRRSHCATGSATATMDLLKFLKEWLLKHIQVTDREAAKHIASRKVA